MTPADTLDIASLRIFLETSWDCNMSRAARDLNISQPAVSQAIRRLEKSLDTVLIERSSRPMRLTLAGRVLCARAKPLMEQFGNLSADVKQALAGKKLDLRFGTSDSFSGSVCPKLLGLLTPLVRNLAAYTGPTPRISRMLLGGELDVAVITQSLAEHKNVTTCKIATENYILVTPEQYADSIHSISDVIALAGRLPVIEFNDKSLDSIQIERVLRQCGIHPERKIEVDTNNSAMGLVRAGLGWSIIPPLGIWMARTEIPGTAIHDVPQLRATRTFYVGYTDSIFAPLASSILEASRSVLRTEILPAMARKIPAMTQYIWMEDGSF